MTGTLSSCDFQTLSISSSTITGTAALSCFCSNLCLYSSGLGNFGGVPFTYINSSLLLLSSTSLSHSLTVNDVDIISAHGPVNRISDMEFAYRPIEDLLFSEGTHWECIISSAAKNQR